MICTNLEHFLAEQLGDTWTDCLGGYYDYIKFYLFFSVHNSTFLKTEAGFLGWMIG